MRKRGRKKLTPWYPRNIGPAIWGWYDVDYFDKVERMLWIEYRWFLQLSDGAFVPVYGTHIWRGIAK